MPDLSKNFMDELKSKYLYGSSSMPSYGQNFDQYMDAFTMDSYGRVHRREYPTGIPSKIDFDVRQDSVSVLLEGRAILNFQTIPNADGTSRLDIHYNPQYVTQAIEGLLSHLRGRHLQINNGMREITEKQVIDTARDNFFFDETGLEESDVIEFVRELGIEVKGKK